MQHAKYRLKAAWQAYLDYEPLSSDCSDEELDTFLRIEEEPSCGMCPALPEHFQMPTPLPGLGRR